jgi:hypothetical protein
VDVGIGAALCLELGGPGLDLGRAQRPDLHRAEGLADYLEVRLGRPDGP